MNLTSQPAASLRLRNTIARPRRSPTGSVGHMRPAIGFIIVALAVLAGAAAVLQPSLWLAIVLAGCGAALAVARPTTFGVPLATAILFSNAAVVAVRYAGLPAVTPLIVPALMVPAVAQMFIVRREPIWIGLGFFGVLGFIGANFLSAIFAPYPDASLEVAIQLVSEAALIYVLITATVSSAEALERVVWAMVLASAVTGALALWQQLFSTNRVDLGGLAIRGVGEDGSLRSAGPIGDPNFFAQILVVTLPFAIGLAVVATRRQARWLTIGCFAAACAGIVLTGSRGGALALIVVAVLLPIIPGVQWRRIAAGVLLVGAILTVAAPGYVERVASLGQLTDVSETNDIDASIQRRLVENAAAIQMFIDHPILGVGPGNYPPLYPRYAAAFLGSDAPGERFPHSLPLELLAELGLVGTLAFGGLIVYLLQSLWRTRSDSIGTVRVMASACIAALAAYLVTGLFLHAAYLRYLWLILAIAGATVTIAARIKVAPEGRATLGQQRFAISEMYTDGPPGR